ncbi:MAG: hypothetical protein ACFFDW_15160, partial [Candidatus Thorarchaeota archaeon]
VVLFYRINGGSWLNIEMNLVSGIIYSATIGMFDYYDYIEYYIQAVDDSPNNNVGFLNNDGLYYNFTVEPGDTTGPTIDSVIFTPLIPTDEDLVTITCNIYDEDGLAYVTFHLRTNYDPWINVSMGHLSGNSYGVTIGTFNYGDQVQFFISAIDGYIFRNIAIEDNSSNYYSFSVLSGEVTAPVINDISRLPEFPNEQNNITISCDVLDNNGVQLVELYYRVNGGNWINVSMNLTLFHTYRATIGPFNYQDLVEYYFYAVDISPNHKEAVDNNGGLYYSFTVISSDTEGPTITNITHYPKLPVVNDSIHITCKANDINNIQSVSLYYSINNGSWTEKSMSLVLDDEYECYLDSLELGDTVKYYIEAIDNSQAHNIAVNDNDSNYYSFIILQQTTSITEDSAISFAFYIPLLTLALLILKRKK